MSKLIIKESILQDNRISFSYEYSGKKFSRILELPSKVDILDLDDDALKRLLMYCSMADSIYAFSLDYFDEIQVPYAMDDHEKAFFEKTLYMGLAEFRYKNNIVIDRTTSIVWPDGSPVIARRPAKLHTNGSRGYVLNGGGKDGAVAIRLSEAILPEPQLMTLEDTKSRQRIADISGLSRYLIARVGEDYVSQNRKLFGHKPMSFCVAMVATLSAYINQVGYVIAANERSADVANLNVDGLSINHQYSKSSEFEKDLQMLFYEYGIPVQYFSIVRPLSELQILKIFATKLPDYHEGFLSCNRGKYEDSWCMSCTKCAFVIGGMYLFNPESAERKWSIKGSGVFARSVLLDQLIELINPKVKPFDCIGTTEENRFLFDELEKINVLDFSDEQLEKKNLYLSQIGAESYDIDLVPHLDSFPDELSTEIYDNIKALLK